MSKRQPSSLFRLFATFALRVVVGNGVVLMLFREFTILRRKWDCRVRAFCARCCCRPIFTLGYSVPILLAIAAVDAGAQALDYGALEALFGEPVTASVTGSPQRASAVPATIEIITADTIRRSGAPDLPALLRHVTGVDVLRWTNSNADVGIRGYNAAFSSRILVLVNGRQVYADHYGYTPWSSLPVELGEIRQIELVKGPNSALFGFNAVGGVINIITFNPAYDQVNYATVQAGTQDLLAVSAARTFTPAANWALRVSGGARKNDDFSTPLRPIHLGARRGDERAALRVDNHVRLAPGVELEVELAYSQMGQSSMLPHYVLARQEQSIGSVRATVNADTAAGLVKASLYRSWIEDAAYPGYFDGRNVIELRTPLADYSNRLIVASVQDIFKLGTAHTVRVSGEYRESELNTSPLKGAMVHYEVHSGGVMWQWQLLETLTLTSAARRDHLALGRTGLVPPGYGLTNAAWDRTLATTSYNTGVVWSLGARDTLRLIAARGAQLPSLVHLGGLLAIPTEPVLPPPALAYFSGTPFLEPVVVTNLELGWDHVLTRWNALLKVALFEGRSRDLLAAFGDIVPGTAILSAPGNIGESTTRGVELSVKGTFADSWRWSAGFLRQRVEDRIAARFPTGITMTAFEETTPDYSVNASLGWTQGRWEADAWFRYQDDFLSIRPDDTFVPDFARPQLLPNVLYPVAGYASLDARIAFQFDTNIVVALSGQNLFTATQHQTAGPDVERRVQATVDWKF